MEEAKPEVCQRLSSLSLELGALSESIRYARGEISDAFEFLESVETSVDKLLAEKAELARSLDETRKRRDELLIAADNDKLKLRREHADALLAVKRLQNALDAALNDVAILKRAAFWLGWAAVVAVLLAIATF